MSTRTAGLWRPLAALLDRTAALHEPRVGGTWRRDGRSQSMIDGLLPGIVGYRLTVERHEASAKMSQNMSPANRRGVAEGLRALDRDGPRAVADMMDALAPE